jgi:hypothetical protein
LPPDSSHPKTRWYTLQPCRTFYGTKLQQWFGVPWFDGKWWLTLPRTFVLHPKGKRAALARVSWLGQPPISLKSYLTRDIRTFSLVFRLLYSFDPLARPNLCTCLEISDAGFGEISPQSLASLSSDSFHLHIAGASHLLPAWESAQTLRLRSCLPSKI